MDMQCVQIPEWTSGGGQRRRWAKQQQQAGGEVSFGLAPGDVSGSLRVAVRAEVALCLGFCLTARARETLC